jgi:hypothetical protein
MGTAPDQPASPPAQKLCIACKKPIPAEAMICFHCRSSQAPEKQSVSTNALKWIGGITAVLGLITGLSGVVGPLKGWWSQGRQTKIMLTTGQKQAELGDYAAAFDTYSDPLKSDPGNLVAIQGRLDVAMLWIENFRVSGKDHDEIAQKAHGLLAQISPVLEAGLTTGKGYRAADIVAHIGWLNLLKVRLTDEDVPVEEHLLRALKMDPTNVYANAMMGDWLLQNNRSLDDAKRHFGIALQSGKARAFVRECELGVMIYNERPGVRVELIRVVNEMRKDGEPIGDEYRGRIHSYYSPGTGSEENLQEVLSAVPPDEAWATYQWIDRPLTEWAPFTPMEQQFIQAKLDEISGKPDEALQLYRQLERETQASDGTLSRRTRAAVKRLTAKR